jgi:hypothetical protein
MLLGRLIVDDDLHFYARGRFADLLNRELRRTTLLLWFIWCRFDESPFSAETFPDKFFTKILGQSFMCSQIIKNMAPNIVSNGIKKV